MPYKTSTQHFFYPFILFSRYECPAGCLDATEKVVGTVYYEMVSRQANKSPVGGFVLVNNAPVISCECCGRALTKAFKSCYLLLG